MKLKATEIGTFVVVDDTEKPLFIITHRTVQTSNNVTFITSIEQVKEEPKK